MKDFYAELIEYTGRHPTLVRERCRVAPVELAWKFDKDRILDTYKQDDLYIFDLTEYQTKLQSDLPPRLIDFLQKCNIKTMLDFGGGIGEYTILAMRNGVEVDFLEVEGSKTLEYAKWRFKKHNVNPGVLTEKADLTDKKYDFVMAMDVFEHIPQPDVAVLIAQLSKITKYLWCNPVGLPYNEYYPQHISHFDEDLRKHFVVAIPQSDLGSIFVPTSCGHGVDRLRHMHDCAHGIEGTHMAGSERYECMDCGHSIYKEEGEKQGLRFLLD